MYVIERTDQGDGYVALFQGKRLELRAKSQWRAVEAAREALKVPKSKYGLLSVVLCEQDGKQVTHHPMM